MTALERTLEEFKQTAEENEQPEKPLYNGLIKLENKSFTGPTSIKYWM